MISETDGRRSTGKSLKQSMVTLIQNFEIKLYYISNTQKYVFNSRTPKLVRS